MKRAIVGASLLGTVLLASGGQAAEAPRREMLSLNATAQIELARDVLSLAFSVTKEGADAGAVQHALKQALESALVEARKVAKPGQVDIQAGNFSIYPRYSSKGGITGWQGSTELLVEGKDMTAIAQLSGRIQSMSIARVNYGLSREARERVESEVTAQAISRFKAKAQEYAKQFGYSGYVIGEVSVNADAPQPLMQAPRFRMAAMAAPQAEDALPVESGKAMVSANVNGSVQLIGK